MKKEKVKVILMWLIVAATFVISIAFYPQLPNRIASHWNASGAVNGYMSRFWGAFLTPLILVAVLLMLIYLPRIDPTRKNAKGFRGHYYDFIIVLLVFMFVVQLYVLLYNVGIKLNINTVIYILIGFLFYFIGVLMENAKRNWFIGIRTPWTLLSETVWDKTHKIGAALFKICGIVAIIGAFFGKYGLYFTLIPLTIVIIYLFVYSYKEYQKETK